MRLIDRRRVCGGQRERQRLVAHGLGEGSQFYVGTATYPLEITYQGGTGNDIVVTAVPEPATMALLSLAACGLGGYVRRRHDWPRRLRDLLLRDHAEHGSLHRATCQR